VSHSSSAAFVPRGALVGAALLIGLSLVAATVARVTDIGASRMPEAAPVASLDLRFEDRPDGAVAVYRAPEDRMVGVLAPGGDNFVRGVLRGLARERRRQDIGIEAPFTLARWDDGRLSLEDPATGRRIDLGAFGPTNIAAFARFMEAPGANP
jgi:putative photosynthetic complex assembly protein